MTRKTQKTFLKCSCCGSIIPIQRKLGKMKKKGHIKTIYCPKCKAETQHIELGPWYDFYSMESKFIDNF